ncbi:MAG: PD-(D/E)XK nuclease family protein [Patescibacteria group bacterium]|nr:PD-(D/E)XK nuclease family protein [Patescibacteria group bacterium]
MTEPKLPSPFLPGTQIRFAWDSTCLSALKTCPRLYQYLYVDFWGHPGESIHLRFGQEYHQALQDYDKSRALGIPHEDAIHDVVRELILRTSEWVVDEDTKAGRYKNRKTVVQAVINYLDAHKDDPAQTYIMQDGKPAVELSFRFELDWGPQAGTSTEGLQIVEERKVEPEVEGGISYGSHEVIMQFPMGQPYLLCGHLDRVVTFSDNLFVMDHKTTTSTPGPYWFDQWSPSNQMTLYSIAAQVILGSPVKGVIINAAQLLLEPPYTKFVRGMTFRTADQQEEWLNDLRHWLSLAEAYATEGYFPMNDTACDKFGGCRFREVCSKSPQVRERFLESDFTKLSEEERWNPLKSRV